MLQGGGQGRRQVGVETAAVGMAGAPGRQLPPSLARGRRCLPPARRVAAVAEATPRPPSPWVRNFSDRVRPGGEVLDLACGRGRHCRLFLDRGHPVTAVDRDAEVLASLPSDARLEVIQADLEAGPWPLQGRRFAGVVVCNYLWRPLLPRIADAVAPGGVLIYETFAAGNQRFGRPTCPDFLLEPGELLRCFQGILRPMAYRHGREPGPPPRMRQALYAVRVA